MATNGQPGASGQQQPMARLSRSMNSSYSYLHVMPDRLAREEDFDRVCRVCSVITTNLQNLFTGVGVQLALVDKINKYLPIKVEKEDGLPQSICRECHEALIAWDELGKQAQLADTVMRRRLRVLSPHVSRRPSAAAGTTSRNGNQSVNSNVIENQSESVESSSDLVEKTEDEAIKVEKPKVVIVENGKRYVSCPTCHKKVPSGSWRRHERAHRGERRHSCATCGLAFVDGGNLARHAALHAGAGRRHACAHCRRAFTRRAHLLEHACARRASALCDVCGRASASAAAARMHRRTHAARAHSCPRCAAAFKRAAELRAHLSVHTGETPHRCACGRAFRLRAQLAAHSRTHERYVDAATDPRPPCPQRVCSYCPLWIPARDYNNHLTHMHAQRVFRCEECHSYLDKSDLLFHMSQHALELSQSENGNDEDNNDEPNRNDTQTVKTEANDVEGATDDLTSNNEDKINKLYERLSDENNTNDTNGQNHTLKEDDIKREDKHEQLEMPNNKEQVHEHTKNDPIENQVKKFEKDNCKRKRDHDGIGISKRKKEEERKEIRRSSKSDNYRLKSRLDAVISRIIQFSPVPLIIPQGLKLKVEDRPEVPINQNKNKETGKMLAKRPKRKKIETSAKNNSSRNIDNQTLPEREEDNADDPDHDNDDDNEVDDSKDSPKSKVSKLSKSKIKSEKSPKASRTCPICGKEYRASSSYFYHMKYFHKRSREHECQACGKKFGTKANLAQHASIHTGAFELECKECGKRFRSKASLYIHEQSHGGVKRWACGQCERSFRWRTHLARHAQRHAAARAHVCSACGRGFSVRCDLLRHARTHAAAEFHCAACGLKFAQKRYLKVHMIKKHFNNHHLHQPLAPPPTTTTAAAAPDHVVTRS